MTQKSRHPEAGGRPPQMGGKHPQTGENRARETGQPQGKKKQGKPEQPHERR